MGTAVFVHFQFQTSVLQGHKCINFDVYTRFQPRLLNCGERGRERERERERDVMCELINVLVRGKGWETSKSAEFAMHCKVYVPPKQEEVHPAFSLVEAALLEVDFLTCTQLAALQGKLCEPVQQKVWLYGALLILSMFSFSGARCDGAFGLTT